MFRYSLVGRGLRLLIVLAMAVAIAGVATVGQPPAPVAASHFRSAQLTWTQTARTTAEFRSTVSQRGATGVKVGDQRCLANVDFGDDYNECPMYTIVFVDQTNDYIIGEAVFTHTYEGVGPYTAAVDSCCRLQAPMHINNTDGGFRAETIVNFAATSASPVSSISPIVDCLKNAVCRFTVPAFDPDKQGLRFRLATSEEATNSGTFTQPGPPDAPNAATIDPATGAYSWNTAGATLAPAGYDTFYSTQVIVENVVNGIVISKTAVDFFIRLADTASTNQPPVFIAPTPDDGTVYNVKIGSPFSFNVAASDPDPRDVVTLSMLGKPSDATYATTPGNPASGTFSWTPTALGTVLLTLTAQDRQGFGATQRSVTINVTTGAAPPPPAATYTLDLSWTAGGSATASPPGPTYPAGTVVTLTAKADIGYAFAGWTVGGVAVGAGNPLVLTMNAGYDVVATFAPGSDGVQGWSAYGAQGGPLTSAPAAASFNGKVYVFARGSDNGLYVKNSVGDGFTAWRALGGDLIGAPAAAVHKGRLYVFARGDGDALYMKSSADGITFTEWKSLGGKLTDAPAAASVNNVLYIFASGTGRALYMKSSLNGVDFTDWKSLGGELTAAPAAAGFKGQVYVFAKGSDNALYERHSNNGVNFSNWLRLDGVLLAAPGAATYTNASGAEQLYVFAHGTDGGLWERHTASGGVYTDWVSLGGQLDGAPAAAGVKGRLYAFVRWANDVLAERHTLR